MIATAEKPRDDARKQANGRFLEMLPWIRHQARRAFRRAPAEQKDELVQEAIGHAFVAYARLVAQGKSSTAFATPLASYAIRRVLAGRQVGGKSNVHDVMSPQARAAYGFAIERLDRFDKHEGEWREALIEDRRAGPAEIAAARLDVAAWFSSLSRRNRRIAKLLAMGETTSVVAPRFNLSRPRVSQLREELRASWLEFQGEVAQPTPTREALKRSRVPLVA